jgi:ribosomal protein L22
MVEEIKQTKEKKETKAIVEKVKEKVAEAKILPQDTKVEQKKETKTEVKEEPKKEEKKIVKKEEAIANGLSIHASKRHCMYICDFIKGKKIDEALAMLDEVIKLKRAIPFKGEIPHRRGMHSGRYPVNACKLFIPILKGLKGNVIVNQMDLDKSRIYYACANWASRPQRKGGVKAKRAHVLLKAKEMEYKK